MISLSSLLFLTGFTLGLALCLVRHPVWGLYTYIAVFYIHPPSRWWGGDLPNLRWALLAAVVTLVCLMFRKRDNTRPSFWSHGLTWIFVTYVTWMWIQTSFAANHQFSVEGAVLFTKYLLLLYLIYETIVNEQRIRDFLLLHLAGCFYIGWLAFNIAGGGRLEGVGGPGINDSNTMSMHLGTGVAIGAMLLMTENRHRFWLAMAFLPFILNGMILGNSRGAFVGLLAGGVCLFFLKPKIYVKKFYIFGTMGAILFVILAHSFLWERLSSLGAAADDEKNLDASAYSRVVTIKAQWQIFLDNPLGAGHRGTTELSPQYIDEQYLTGKGENKSRSSHNLIMSVLVDHGIPGIFLFALAFAWIKKSISIGRVRFRNNPALGGYVAAIAAGLTVAFVAGLFAPYLKAEIIYWLLGLLISARALADKYRSVANDKAKKMGRSTSDLQGFPSGYVG